MAVVTVYVPINGNEKETSGWICNVSAHIDAGNDVQFYDANSTSTPVSVSRINLASDGAVTIWGAHETISDAQTMYFLAGHMHVCTGIHGIRADDTDTSIGIKTKI